MHKPTSQWRTVIVALAGIFALTLGLILVGYWTGAAGAYGAFALGIAGCVGAVAGKAGWQHKENAKAAVAPEPQA